MDPIIRIHFFSAVHHLDGSWLHHLDYMDPLENEMKHPYMFIKLNKCSMCNILKVP